MVDFRTLAGKLLVKAYRAIMKADRAPIAPWAEEPTPKIREPRWDYPTLVEIARTNWVLLMCFRAIIQEALRPRWSIKPMFKKKCTSIKCGAEYDKEVKVCEICQAETRGPSEIQYQKLEKLLEKPNRDYGFEEALRSAIFFDLALDDWYLSIAYQTIQMENGAKKRVASEVYVEDARYMRIVADEKGHLGGKEWFCPTCYTPDIYFTPTRPEEQVCPTCGAQLLRTAYVMEVNGQIKARFGEDEIIHGSGRILPELYGSPRIIALWKLLQTMKVMDDYNWEVYSEGKVGSLVFMPGMGQEAVDALIAKMQSELERKDAADITTGVRTTRKKIRTLFFGGEKPASVVKVMEDLEKMQSLEYYKFFRDAVCAVYGVTPVFVSVIESGRAGNNPRMQIDVQNRTTREAQAGKEDVINNFLLPKFEITDWYFEFNRIEAEDELRTKQIEQIKAETARTYLQSGFRVEFDEFGELKVSGVGELVEKTAVDKLEEVESKLRRLLSQQARSIEAIQTEVKTLGSLEENVQAHEKAIANIRKSEARRFSSLKEELYGEYLEELRERRKRKR